MATITAHSRPALWSLDADRRDYFGLVLSAGLPLAAFVIANGMAKLGGFVPLFFSPFGLPGWMGAALYLGALPLFGAARWLVAREGMEGRIAGWWIVALMAGAVVFPFLATPLDSLALSIASMLLILLGVAAAGRAAKVSPLAAMLMLPGLLWLGFSALVGLSFVAAWSPPFALTNTNNAL